MIEKWDWEDEINSELFKIREHLHKNPELSFEEHHTHDYICDCLNNWGIPYKTINRTGIIVDIWGEEDNGKRIALRADIDALPITEESGVDFSSEKEGIMHACGHDGHTTILLGAIYHLWKHKNNFKGLVRGIFQPGEESDGAAQEMIEKGALENPKINNIIGLHLWPKLPLGSVGTKEGIVTASCDDFVINITGKGGHAARPQEGIDAIIIGNEVVNALKVVQLKWFSPTSPFLIHIGKFVGGYDNNVIADNVVLEGTVRTVSKSSRQKAKKSIKKIISNIVDSYKGEVDIKYIEGHPPVINDSEVTKAVEQSAAEIVGKDNIYDLGEPSMGADDFGFFSECISSSYFRLGIKETGKNTYDLHHPKFYFNREVIPVGAKIFTQFAMDTLTQK